jgi:D-beta-D-heptose 7-phosphate kinase/D-beta-D-heptose 1-phosphate adenosyltransferase
MLARARASCDRLVIGLAGDRSCLAPEGFAPLPARERARALALLPTVDLIVEDDEETPEELLQALRPDLLVGGGSRADMLGADLVRAWGGRIILADRLTEPAAD